jgi:uncharacterized repeat protein (TIGR02543 family)
MLLGLLTLLLSTASVAGAAPFAYVSYSSALGGRVAVIDASPTAACSNPGDTPPCVVKTLVVGASPAGVAVNPAGTFAYVANAGDNSVSVIRTSNNPSDIAVVATIRDNVKLFGPWGVAVSPDNTRVYVGLSNGFVAMIDSSNFDPTSVVQLPAVGGLGMLNGIVAVGSRIFVSDATNSQVVVIDGPTQRVIKAISVGSPPNSNPMGLVVNPSGTRVYVADVRFDDTFLIDVFEVSGIDTALLDVVETFVIDPFPLNSMSDNTLAAPGGVALSPDGRRLYVVNDGLAVVNPVTHTIQNDVTIITLSDGSRAHVTVDTSPVGIATDPTGRAYVANHDSGTVSVIDPSTNTVVQRVGLGGGLPSVFGAFTTAGPPQFQLTLTTVGGGSIAPQPASATGSYDAGSAVMLTAMPDANSQFTGWSGDCSGTSITCTVTMDAAKRVTATFTPLYTLSVTTLGSGTVAAQPTSAIGKYLAGTVVTLTATADAGFQFTSWAGACSGNSGTCSVTMDATKSVTATFTPLYTLFLTTLGSGTISALPTPTAGKYLAGTLVTLTATPAADSVFGGWAGACSVSSTTCTVTMDATKSVTATFTLKQFMLTLNTVGSGTIGAQPSSATGVYNLGTPVTLTATPASGFQFSAWSGACSGTVATCGVTMDAAKTVTATFTAVQYTLNVSKVGSGMVTAQPPSATGKYNAGAVVTLTATPDPGFQFAGWTNSNPCSGTGPCVVTMNGDKSETATFTVAQYTLNVSKVGSGMVTAQPPSATGTYNAGAVVTLTATPDPGYQFAGWSNSNPCSGTGTCIVTMDGNKSENATFTAMAPQPSTCDAKINDLQAKVAADKHPWSHQHQLKAALRLYPAAQAELGKAKVKVGDADKRYGRALKEFNEGKSALCHGQYWHAHHDLWESYFIAHEILKNYRR